MSRLRDSKICEGKKRTGRSTVGCLEYADLLVALGKLIPGVPQARDGCPGEPREDGLQPVEVVHVQQVVGDDNEAVHNLCEENWRHERIRTTHFSE